MNKEDIIKKALFTRGFSEKTLLNNRGLIGAVIEELQSTQSNKSAEEIPLLKSCENLITSYMLDCKLPNVKVIHNARIAIQKIKDFANQSPSKSELKCSMEFPKGICCVDTTLIDCDNCEVMEIIKKQLPSPSKGISECEELLENLIADAENVLDIKISENRVLYPMLKRCFQISLRNEELQSLPKETSVQEDKMHYDSLLECCNKMLDSVDKGNIPTRQIMGLRILLNRPKNLNK